MSPYLRIVLTVLFYILLFVILLKLFSLGREVLQRMRFVARLKRSVARTHGQVRVLHFPLRSLFFVYDGEDIVVETGEKQRMKLKFFPYFIRAKTVVLKDARRAHLQKNLMLFSRAAVNRHAEYLQVSAMYRGRDKKYSSVFSKTKGESILLFSPVPYSMQGIENGRSAVLDNGVSIFGFSVYTTKGFLQRLER